MIHISDIERARDAVTPFVRGTPIDRSRTISRELGHDTVMKLEMFQVTGSFKPRGAFNRLLGIEESALQRGVVAISGGNFAQAVAYAGRELGVSTRVIMPISTPSNYLDATRSYGATVEQLATFPEMFTRVEQLENEGLTFVHPYDDPDMMAGNGTLGLELHEQAPEITDVFVSIGGGGLLAGMITALKARSPEVRIWGVETEGSDGMRQALRAGEPVQIEPTSLAKTLGAPVVAEDAVRGAQQHLEDLIVVSDREAFEAQAFLLERAKLVTELAASCTLAAARQVKNRLPDGARPALVLCGGNVSAFDVHDLVARFGRG